MHKCISVCRPMPCGARGIGKRNRSTLRSVNGLFVVLFGAAEHGHPHLHEGLSGRTGRCLRRAVWRCRWCRCRLGVRVIISLKFLTPHFQFFLHVRVSRIFSWRLWWRRASPLHCGSWGRSRSWSGWRSYDLGGLCRCGSWRRSRSWSGSRCWRSNRADCPLLGSWLCRFCSSWLGLRCTASSWRRSNDWHFRSTTRAEGDWSCTVVATSCGACWRGRSRRSGDWGRGR